MNLREVHVVILGDSGVGKTALIRVLARHEFNEFQRPTSVADVDSLVVTSPTGEQLKLSLWDTAGQEAQRSLSVHYIRGAQIVMLAYAVNRPDSLANIREWHGIAADVAPNATFVLVTTKGDLQHAVPESEAEQMAASLKCARLQTSAKTGDGVADLEQLLVDVAGAERATTDVGTVDIAKPNGAKGVTQTPCC
jgi:small GTP-binding protein